MLNYQRVRNALHHLLVPFENGALRKSCDWPWASACDAKKHMEFLVNEIR